MDYCFSIFWIDFVGHEHGYRSYVEDPRKRDAVVEHHVDIGNVPPDDVD